MEGYDDDIALRREEQELREKRLEAQIAGLREELAADLVEIERGIKEAARKRDEVAERLDAPSLNSAQLAVQNFRALTQPELAVSLRIPTGGWDRATTSVQPTRSGQRPGESSVPNPALSPAPL